MILERIHVEEHRRTPITRPTSVPAVAQWRRGPELRAPVTFLVGENGSGESTLVEAVAEQLGVDAQGGLADRRYASDRRRTALGAVRSVDTSSARRGTGGGSAPGSGGTGSSCARRPPSALLAAVEG